MGRVGRRRSEPREAGEVGGGRRGAFVDEPRGAQGLHHRRWQVLEQPRSAPSLAPALAPTLAPSIAPALGLVRAAAAASHRRLLRLLRLLGLLAAAAVLALALALTLALAARLRPAPPAVDRGHGRRPPAQQQPA